MNRRTLSMMSTVKLFKVEILFARSSIVFTVIADIHIHESIR